MDRIVNRIKLNRLFSEPQIFDPIIFHDGVNIILGEKYDSSTVSGRKTIGVGKSISIEFLNFCLLKSYSDSRVKLIPEDVLEKSVYIKLDLEIGFNKLIIMRNRENHEKPIIEKDGVINNFENLSDAQLYLRDLLYNKLKSKIAPSFRELMAPLIRDERSGFKDILECFDTKRKIPVNFTPHLFYLNIPLEPYKETQKIIKKISDIKKVAGDAKKQVTENNCKKIGEVKAELNALDFELEKINETIESFKSNDAFHSIEKDLIRLEDLLDKLRTRQKVLKYELKKIKSLPQPEKIEDDEMKIIYNQFKQGLGDMVVKTLQETIAFKDKVEKFQKTLINQRMLDLQNELNDIAENIKKLDEEYSEKLKIVDQKGILKNLKVSLKIYNKKNNEYIHLKSLYEKYESAEKEKKSLYLKKTQELHSLDEMIENNKKVLDSFLSTLLDIHEIIMGNKECSFMIDTVDKKNSKKSVEIEMRIFDDGSHSVDRTKVFIYDMALLFNEHVRKRHPCFMIHDNIFDVDQDTLVRSLNFLKKQEEKYQDFQYILTLNRDKIEHEERLKNIKLDIEMHKVATFTKKQKFLKKDYQEL